MRHLKARLLAASLFGLLTTPALASGIYSFTSALVANEGPLNLGFVFTTNVPITVTSLGYYDEDDDGFAADHVVGIYDGAGNLITSITLDVGTSDTLSGGFRYHSITPIILPGGKTYVLAATTGGYADGWAYGVAGDTLLGLTVDPAITIAADAARYLYETDNALQNPLYHYGNYTLYAGPNFTYTSVGLVTPEPGTLGLTLAGIALAIGIARRRRE
jgi:hypothetical protein